jgi:hypothetical protein
MKHQEVLKMTRIISRPATIAVMLMLAIAAILAVPRVAIGASAYPTHYANLAICWGAGNPAATRNYIEVPAPVVWAADRRAGVLDTQYVTWRADLLVWSGSSWATQIYGDWAPPFITYDGDGIAPAFVDGDLVLRGTKLAIPQLSRFYSVRITVHWYAVGSMPATEHSILPGTFLEPADGWLPSAGQYCDYTPDSGSVPLP